MPRRQNKGFLFEYNGHKKEKQRAGRKADGHVRDGRMERFIETVACQKRIQVIEHCLSPHQLNGVIE
jgi:hypothetical protein